MTLRLPTFAFTVFLALPFAIVGVAAVTHCNSSTQGFAPVIDGGGGGRDAAASIDDSSPSDGLGTACAGGNLCVGNDIYSCDPVSGEQRDKIRSCDKGEVCVNGACSRGCSATEQETSSTGCEFWAVDLDNEYPQASSAPWGIVVSNASDVETTVTLEVNAAIPGSPKVLQSLGRYNIAPGKLRVFPLPSREVDGSFQNKNEGPGTYLSSRAVRVASTQPIVVYQFNALESQFSNDASLLLPTPALGRVYRALSWPAAKPVSIDIGGIKSPIDRGYVTIVGTEDGTDVEVRVAQKILAGGGIPATDKNGVVKTTLNRFDVLNLETDGAPGDLTGSIVNSSKPVAVFVGTELSAGSVGTAPFPPSNDPEMKRDTCCLDHVEEQLLPVESYGKQFLVPRSPPRGSSYIEPDSIRLMGVAKSAQVTTNLPAPNNTFTLAPGQFRDFFVDKNFTVEANEPIAVGQVLLSSGLTEEAIGDPSLTVFPAIDQFRRNYLFQVPTSWRKNYLVLTAKVGAAIAFDDKPLVDALTGCNTSPIGALGNTDYEAIRCPISEGPHRVSSAEPFGVTAYGYGNRGSYSFVGGSNVNKIYTPPTIR
jgi:IgGFc binding protein